MMNLARNTGSVAPPTAIEPTATAADCKTSQAGATTPNAADSDGGCPLVFDIPYASGSTTVSTAVLTGMRALLVSLRYDVHPRVSQPDGGTAVIDTFIASALPLPNPTNQSDPVTGAPCVSISQPLGDLYSGPRALLDGGADGLQETVSRLNLGPAYCVVLRPVINTAVPAAASAQVFHVDIDWVGDKPGAPLSLGAPRRLWLIVPPIAP